MNRKTTIPPLWLQRLLASRAEYVRDKQQADFPHKIDCSNLILGESAQGAAERAISFIAKSYRLRQWQAKCVFYTELISLDLRVDIHQDENPDLKQESENVVRAIIEAPNKDYRKIALDAGVNDLAYVRMLFECVQFRLWAGVDNDVLTAV